MRHRPWLRAHLQVCACLRFTNAPSPDINAGVPPSPSQVNDVIQARTLGRGGTSSRC